MPTKLSPSRLGVFAECARCFWRVVKHGHRRPQGPYPSLPSGMDREIKAYFDRYRAEHVSPPELAADAALELHPDQAFVDEARDWRQDPQLTDARLDVVLRGGVDELLVTDDGALCILDFKTRGYPPRGDGAPDYYRRQLNLYSLLFDGTGHETADRAYLLYYHPEAVAEGGTVRFRTELVEVAVDLAAARQLLEEAVEQLARPLPPPTRGCEFCAWAEASLHS